MMTERLLQFIWQFQHYNTTSLATANDEALQILHIGQYNHNQGPDFLNAKIKVGETTWVGNIELHVNASDWHKHQHSRDDNYHNIILHVVWQNDVQVYDLHGKPLATLILQDKVSQILLSKYTMMQQQVFALPCQNYLPVLDDFKWNLWKERLCIERLQRKSAYILQLLAQANNHWEEVLWWMLARNFGAKVNADIFESMARSLPIKILARHKQQIHQLESLVFGQSGLLMPAFTEDYPVLLQKEYKFLQQKYKLEPCTVKPFFLRMRPANFPTIRLAQLAMLVHQSAHLFSKMKEADDISDISKLLNITPNDYWLYHYLFDEPGPYKPKPMGMQMINNILINTVVPLLFAYGIFTKNDHYKDKALQWLGMLDAEKNTITSHWKSVGIINKSGLDSQALIELKNNYCLHIKCLDCPVGIAILKN